MMNRIDCPHCSEEIEVHFYDDDTSKQDDSCNECEGKFTYQVKIEIVNIETEE